MRLLHFLSLAICVTFSTTFGQLAGVKAGAVPTSLRKVDTMTVSQYWSLVKDLCTQCSRIKLNLPAATRLKAAPGITTVQKAWRSRPGSLDAINLARSEVRRIFGSLAANVENVLVCYLFGESLGCTDKSPSNDVTDAMWTQREGRNFSAVSNVLKAVADEKNSTINNIR
jgi:hypothetical protein